MADGGVATAVNFLGVSCSLSGRAWLQRPAEAETVRAHMQGLGLAEPLARALAARGVTADQGEDFLSPTLRALFPDPSSFLDMDKAAEVILDALTAGRSIHVFADYDVDGASSAALLVRWFRAMGADLPIYVPDRLTEGYGPSPKAFETLKASGADLVITVDCGAAAVEAVAHAAAIGLKVVVVDHHLMREQPPPARRWSIPTGRAATRARAIWAAAGVVFVLLAALNRAARARGLFAARAEPDLRQWLDLAALGAICDVTALNGFNRALAALGLKVMSDWRNPGLAALLAVAGMEPGPAKASHAGFILGPRINAGGRIGRADLGARLLSTDDPAEAARIAAELDALNTSRREVEREVTEAAVRQVESRGPDALDRAIIVVEGEGWHPGVVGIVAGRLRERWRKPVIVIGVDPATGVGKGSGRSQPGVNLGRAGAGCVGSGAPDGGRRPRHGRGPDRGGGPHRGRARLSGRGAGRPAGGGRGSGRGGCRCDSRLSRGQPESVRGFRAPGAVWPVQSRAAVRPGPGHGARARGHDRRPCALPADGGGRRLGQGHRLALR